MVELDLLAADLDLVVRGELRLAVDHGHLPPLRQPVEAAGQLADDVLLPGAELVQVDLRLREGDPEARGVLGLGEHLRRVEQRLRRDAADVQADAADPLMALDQRHLQAEVGGAERGRIPAGPRPHDHEALPLGRLGLLLLGLRLLASGA